MKDFVTNFLGFNDETDHIKIFDVFHTLDFSYFLVPFHS